MNFNFSNPYASTRLPVFARNVVSTSHPLAAQAGLRMLYKGGNAVDAAVAAAAAMTDLRAREQRPGQRRLLHPVGRQGPARPERLGPRAADLDAGLFQPQIRPGRAHAAQARHRRGHRARRREQLGGDERALRQAALCRPDGSRPSRSPSAATCCRWWCSRSGRPPRPSCSRCRASPRPSCPGGGRRRWASCSSSRPPHAGCAPSPNRAARRSTAARSPQAIERFSAEHGGSLKASDFAAYQPEWVKPIAQGLPRLHPARDPAQRPGHCRADRAGHPRQVRPGAALPVDGVDSQHLQIEAMKLAFADVYRYVAEPSSMEVTRRADAR